MKKFKFLFFTGLLFLLVFPSCDKKSTGEVVKMHWDRDMCERCKMAISERKFAVQIIEPESGRDYKFDDIGCAVLWMDETNIPWRDQAIIWVTDAKSGLWLDAREAKYTEGAITPMAFGFAAYSDETLPDGAKTYDLPRVTEKIREIEKKNTHKVRNY